MNRILCLLLLPLLAGPLAAQSPVALPVHSYTNPVPVGSATNFFSHNAAAISNAIALGGFAKSANPTLTQPTLTQATLSGDVTVSGLTPDRALVLDGSGILAVSPVSRTELGYLDGVTSALQAQLNGLVPFAYNAALSSGTNAYFNPGKISFPDGRVLAWAGGSVACIAGRTNFVGINLFTGNAHALRRKVDMGTVFLGRVVCDGSGITSATSFPIVLPPGRVERFKSAVRYPQHRRTVILHGNSIASASFGDTTNHWFSAVFTATASPTTWRLGTNLAELTIVDRSYGGQRSDDAMAFTGVGTTAVVVTNDNRSAAFIYGADYVARWAPAAVHQEDVALAQADLVVIYDYFNGGRENLFWIETLVRRYRSRGAEVLLCVDNRPRDTDPATDDLYNAYQAIADTHGCGIADCQSYSEEQQSKGVLVHADTNHPNQAGNDAHAESVRGVFNDYVLPQDFPPASSPVGRAAMLTDYGYTNGIVPRRFDVQFVPASTTGAYVATGIGDSSDYIRCLPGVNLGGRTTNDCVLELEQGEVAYYAHPFATGMRVFYESKSAGSSLAVKSASGAVTLKTFSIASDDPALKGGEALQASEVLVSNGGTNNDPTGAEGGTSPLRNWTVRLESTSGTTRLLGVAWHTVPWQEVPRTAMTFSGVWGTDTYASLVNCPYSDTSGSAVSFSFVGSGCVVLLALHPSAGRIDVWLDGQQVQSDYNLLETTGRFTRSLLLRPNGAASGYGPHTVRIVQDGATGSAAAVAAGLRRLMILGVLNLDLR